MRLSSGVQTLMTLVPAKLMLHLSSISTWISPSIVEPLLPLALGEAPSEDRPSFAALGQPLFADARVQRAFSDGRWTYARNFGEEEEPAELLFDRRVDPGENVNLVSMEPRVAERLRARLDAHLAQAGEGLRRTGVHIEPGIAERLRALGYLDGTP